MKKKIFIVIGLATILSLLMGGCTVVRSKFARLTTDFHTLASDNRIVYENGAEKLALEASLQLDQAIFDVESRQFGKLIEPITVYAFATPKSFSAFSGVSDKARGAAIGNEIYLSSLLKDLPNEVYGMIGHEISHVQLTQKLGVITFNRNLPRWFREGLAIYVSDGGGAPRNYEQETIAMLTDGKHFLPKSKGTTFNISLPSTADIGPRMFYSQSGMFVKYLVNTYPLEFRALLNRLQEGKPFDVAYEESFGDDVENTFTSYITYLKIL